MSSNWPLEHLTYAPHLACPGTLTLKSLHSLCPHVLRRLHKAPKEANLGKLDELPVELLFSVFENLPIHSLLSMRNTSRHVRYVIDSLPSFDMVMQHAPQMVYAVLVLQPSTSISILDLLKKLRQKECDSDGCSALAPLIWIPTASRLCLGCMQARPLPLEHDDISNVYGFGVSDLPPLPTYTFPACTFRGGRFKRCTAGATLYDTAAVSEWILRRWGLRIQPTSHLMEHQGWMFSHSPYDRVAPPPDATALPTVPRRPRLHMATVIAPWVEQGKAEMGVFCSTCLYTEKQDRVYTRRGFEEHLQSCRVHTWDIHSNCWFQRKWQEKIMRFLPRSKT